LLPAAQFRCRQKSPGARHAGLQDAPAPLKSLAAQDALTSLIKGSGGSSNGTSTAGALNSADLARAFALYQSELEQLLAGIGTTRSASII
jgi:hypothetical protein